MKDKFDPGEENRTFESRLQFIAGVFSKPFTKTEILTSCIQFKLNKSYEQYTEEVNNSLDQLLKKDPLTILTKIN